MPLAPIDTGRTAILIVIQFRTRSRFILLSVHVPCHGVKNGHGLVPLFPQPRAASLRITPMY